MIFVTVGTHEQPFNRLIEEIDKLKGDGFINDDVIIQKGYSTYEPKFCTCYDLISYEEMEKYFTEARIVITHGGPASFIASLSLGKTPIVVPRQKKFNEHVNDHQLEFCKRLKEKKLLFYVVDDISNLKNVLETGEFNSSSFVSNNEVFCQNIKNEIIKLFY